MLSDSESVIALSGKLTDYITEGLSKVATDGVSVYPVSDPASFTYERSFEEKSCTVASMRLDGIVSAITGLSRTRSAELISAGLVQISGIAEENLSREVTVGDTVTVRGYGKFRIDSTDGLTKKSRIRITVKKYT